MSETMERMLPLYEGKMIHQYDHRWATYERSGVARALTAEEKESTDFLAIPRYWVREDVVADRLRDRWSAPWLLGWRDICRSTDERTMIASIIGESASPEGGILMALPSAPSAALTILANWNAFVFDYLARQKVGGTHLKYFTLRQLPMLSRESVAQPSPWSPGRLVGDWISRRVTRLIHTATDMRSLGDGRPPAWESDARPSVRAEIDAAMFHLYGIEREDVDYIMETFPIVKRKDIAAHGEYRTKRMILEIYDEMAEAIASGTTYVSPFDEELAGD